MDYAILATNRTLITLLHPSLRNIDPFLGWHHREVFGFIKHHTGVSLPQVSPVARIGKPVYNLDNIRPDSCREGIHHD